MKKIFILIFTIVILSGCSTGLDGKRIQGLEGSTVWWYDAPLADRMHYYRNYTKVYQLCSIWDKEYNPSDRVARIIRSTISEILIKKGEDPMLCRNPASDKGNIAIDKANAAERRARAAEAAAAEAEDRAREAERRAIEAERRANDY